MTELKRLVPVGQDWRLHQGIGEVGCRHGGLEVMERTKEGRGMKWAWVGVVALWVTVDGWLLRWWWVDQRERQAEVHIDAASKRYGWIRRW
jgi:hypothetical protein